MLDWYQSDRRDPWLPALRNWKWSEFRERWLADFRDRWLWKRWAILVFSPMLAADAVLAVLEKTKCITPHRFNTCSEVVYILSMIAFMLLSGHAAERRKKSTEAEANS